jgi:omega-amidase
MRDLTITLVQADQLWEDPTGNFTQYESLLANVGETDLIVLPEMFQTGFSMNTSLAEKMDGASIAWLKKLAAEKNSAVYTSLMIAENDTFYNRGVFVRPSGELEIYDKRKTFGLAKESDHFTAGTHERIVQLHGWSIQLQICYDLRFPENVRNRVLTNGHAAYDLLLYVANWPNKRSFHWKTLLTARAIENQCYVVGVNRVGTDAHQFTYSGDSKSVNPLGVETLLTPNESTILTVVLNKSELGEIREMLPFLRDR